MAEKMRVHILAKQLNVPSKLIIQKCKAEGLSVTNHMSTLTAGLEATVREWFSDGQHTTTVETAERVDLVKAHKAAARKRAAREAASAAEAAATATHEEQAPMATRAVAEAPGGVAVADVGVLAPPADAPPAPIEVAADMHPPLDGEATPAAAVVEAPTVCEPDPLSGRQPDAAVERPLGAEQTITHEPQGPVETAPSAEMPAPSGEAEVDISTASVEAPAPPQKIEPAGPQNVPRPVQLKGPRVVRYEPVNDTQYRPPPRRHVAHTPDVQAPQGPVPAPGDAPSRRRGRGRPVGPDQARRGRQSLRGDVSVANEKLKEWRDRDLVERRERISDATGRRIHTRRAVEGASGAKAAGPAPPKTEATVQEPIVMKSFCAAIGISMMHLLPVLRREFRVVASMNMELTAEMAEYVALEHGVTLTILPARTALDEIEEEFANREPEDLRTRPPVVAFLGHVDHGKTSLLDAIRKTHVTDHEDGGITQHIGAYFLEHITAGKITCVDTPGHAAFTAMRARGAQITDIVVLVVAADDGVMPQTVEAINHAKAAEVPVVVALNKIDLGVPDLHRIYGQLSEHGLQPSGDWGGDTDVIHTSATTGTGIDELIEHLTALGEVHDLKADYQGDATGTVIEAETKAGVGAVVRVLVQSGTLRTGNVLVCGNAFGKVRALVDDRGNRVKEAGPSMPVEVWGLDEVPLAGDRFYQVKSLQRAKPIAEDSRRRRLNESRAQSRRARSLEEVVQRRDAGAVPGLNVIIKADVDGSLGALRTMLLKIPTDEVKLSIRHAAVGAVTDSDTLLADASDAIIVAFRVHAGAGTKRLAEDKGVDIRQYKVIYEVGEDIKKALEGLLAPEESIEVRATCNVREVFNITKVGTVAGCLVTEGVVQRSHLLRLIRDGTIVRDGNKIASLRRFKEDVKEIRAGMECGIRFEGFNDIKLGDVIEVIEVVKTARTL